MLETAFQGVNAVIGSISNLFKGDDEPPAAEYIAEGARGCAYQQPAGGTQRGTLYLRGRGGE
ncbi:hypothetical protein I7653_09615 [Escherichia coli]